MQKKRWMMRERCTLMPEAPHSESEMALENVRENASTPIRCQSQTDNSDTNRFCPLFDKTIPGKKTSYIDFLGNVSPPSKPLTKRKKVDNSMETANGKEEKMKNKTSSAASLENWLRKQE
ncbi:hypothetical protein CEXT_161041 [Caerostris extrusa]|uniref:Uncharacterized protein n=1 Tax=Caerostris extrusa TaxID=172846 RepID=A0AAV4W7R3_CAEEX|nr:hypothetical protein CEXT_161041 [Caerostris extrusa]